MFSDSYTTIENGDDVIILKELNKKVKGSPFYHMNVRLICHSLSFYNGYSLYEVSDFSIDPARVVSFICKEGATADCIYILDGTNEPIYNLNKVAPIFLNEENIFLYARFFFHYVRGRFGKFNIIESVDDVNWKEEPTLSGRKALAKMIQPLSLKDTSTAEEYNLISSIIFKDSLFESDISIHENGNVALSNQEMLVEDIPVVDDNFQQ